MSEAGRMRPLCARPARFLRENSPDVSLRLEGRRVVFDDPRRRPGLAEYVRAVEAWIADELAREAGAARRQGRY